MACERDAAAAARLPALRLGVAAVLCLLGLLCGVYPTGPTRPAAAESPITVADPGQRNGLPLPPLPEPALHGASRVETDPDPSRSSPGGTLPGRPEYVARAAAPAGHALPPVGLVFRPKPQRLPPSQAPPALA